MYTMYTGQGDPYKLATIAAFNGKEKLGKFIGLLRTIFKDVFFILSLLFESI